MSSLLDSIDDFVWGRIDETEYLKRVVEENNVDTELFLSKVKAIQQDLNFQLRKGVEENHSRLLEQVGAIESLDTMAMQTDFDDEMRAVYEKAEKISRMYNDSFEQLKSDSISLQELTSLSRVINDGIKCKQLVELWETETDLLSRAECVSELKLLCAENPSFSSILWMKNGFLKQIPEITSKTCKMAIEELKTALLSLNVSVKHDINNCLKALNHLFDQDGCNQKIKTIIDEAIKEIDALFLNLSITKSAERAAKQSPQLGSSIALPTNSFLTLGNKLNAFLEQFQLLGIENAQKFSNGVASIMRQRIPAFSFESSIRLVQTITKCLMPHSDAVSKPIRDALGPVKSTLLSRSLENLQELVDDVFTHDDKKGIVIVEKINAAIKAELTNVSWDPELQKMIEGNIAKAFQIIGNKIEFQLSFTPETLQLTGRVTKLQSTNYQLLSIAQAFRRQWPLFSDCLRAVIDPHLKVIVDTMKVTISLVLDSMHDEFKGDLAPNQSSMFMREVGDHLKVFRTHVSQIAPLAESLEALPNFINFVVEQFLLHISLIRPLSTSTTHRFNNDLSVLCKSLQGFNCKSSKYLNHHKQLAEFIRHLPDVSDSNMRNNIPNWLAIHFLICASPTSLCLPHESADFTRQEYIQWFNEHPNVERYQFLQNLIASFEQSNENVSKVPHLPKIKELLQKELVSQQKA